MIKKLLDLRDTKANTMIKSAECGSCPIYKEQAFNNGRYADMMVANSTIYSDEQLTRLRSIGPRIYELRQKLLQCEHNQRRDAASWLVELDELCEARRQIFREAIKMPGSWSEPYFHEPQSKSSGQANW